jgi:6-phosphofructokinase 1
MIKKLLLLCSGGDAPGMNAVIRAAVRTALYHHVTVFGAESGYCGLLNQKIFPLTGASVANCIMRGGTILKTGRCPDFHEKPTRDQCREFLRQQKIDALIVLGGNGSFAGASLIEQEDGPCVIGVPCTIDNDVNGTEYCIGFDTARNTALNAIDKIRDTAFSLDRNFIIEIMGRKSGFLAVDVGIAGGAEIILIPEFPTSTEQLIKKIQTKRRQKLGSLIVAAEAGEPNSSIRIANDIKTHTGIEYKTCILGHIQRGGTPTVMDRKLGSEMGAQAVRALLNDQSQCMTAVEAGKITLVPFSDPQNATRFFSDDMLLQLNEIICESK